MSADDLIRSGYAAFIAGDMATATQYFEDPTANDSFWA